jgi:hypothetical protein
MNPLLEKISYNLLPSKIKGTIDPNGYHDLTQLKPSIYIPALIGTWIGEPEANRDNMIAHGWMSPNEEEFYNTDYSRVLINSVYQTGGIKAGDMAVNFAQSIHNFVIRNLDTHIFETVPHDKTKADAIIAAENILLLEIMRYYAVGAELHMPTLIETFNSSQLPAEAI